MFGSIFLKKMNKSEIDRLQKKCGKKTTDIISLSQKQWTAALTLIIIMLHYFLNWTSAFVHFSTVHECNPLKTSPDIDMHGTLLYKRRKTLQSWPIRYCMSTFQRGTSLLACMHNHTSERPHRYDSYRECKFICSPTVRRAFLFQRHSFLQIKLCRASQQKDTHRGFFFFFYLHFVVQLLNAAVFAW